MNKWTKRFAELATLVASWSKDPSTTVGAVLISNSRPRLLLGIGYNGFPAGHDDSPELYADRGYKYEHVIHAEVNALNNAIKLGGPSIISGATMMVSFPPCAKCMEAMGLHGVSKVIFPALGDTPGITSRSAEWLAQWEAECAKAEEVAARYAITLEKSDGF